MAQFRIRTTRKKNVNVLTYSWQLSTKTLFRVQSNGGICTSIFNPRDASSYFAVDTSTFYICRLGAHHRLVRRFGSPSRAVFFWLDEWRRTLLTVNHSTGNFYQSCRVFSAGYRLWSHSDPSVMLCTSAGIVLKSESELESRALVHRISRGVSTTTACSFRIRPQWTGISPASVTRNEVHYWTDIRKKETRKIIPFVRALKRVWPTQHPSNFIPTAIALSPLTAANRKIYVTFRKQHCVLVCCLETGSVMQVWGSQGKGRGEFGSTLRRCG